MHKNFVRLATIMILIGFVALAILYSQSIPLFEASDEAEHFIYIHTILETGKLPVIQSRDEMANQSDPILRWNNQSHHAPLYYLLSAGLISWTDRDDLRDYLRSNEIIFLRNITEDNPNKWMHFYTQPTSDTHIAIYWLRAMNVIIGCATLFLIYLTAKAAFEDEVVALLSMLLVASIPTFIAVNVSVTNDALVIFLYSAGLLWSVRTWKSADLSWQNTLLIAVILAGIALTKLTGVTLFGVVYFTLMLIIWRKKWTRFDVVRFIIITLGIPALFAGWWYLRNFQLYGDPLALAATASIWGRDTPFTLAMFSEELLRIARTFWMMVGYLHEPVLAPGWFYVYAALATVGAILGYIWHLFTKRNFVHAILGFALLVVTGMLLYGTRSVDISYGRLLFPALAAFAPLFVLGWKRILGVFALIVILPVTFLAILAPLHIIPTAYETLEPVDTIPDSATRINWTADNLEIVAVDVPHDILQPHDSLSVDVYFRGNHPLNPLLMVTAIDSVRVARLDHVEIYPGMASTDNLPDDQVYRVTVHLQLNEPEDVRQPRIVILNLEWGDAGEEADILFDNGQSVLEVQAGTFVDPRYEVVGRAIPVEDHFDNAIQLDFYCYTSENIQFIWTPLQNIRENWTLTIQLFDSDSNLVTQTDGELWWYPTSAWAVDERFRDVRDIDFPDDFNAEDYEIRVGWYRQDSEGNFVRMPITQGEAVDNLLLLPDAPSTCN